METRQQSSVAFSPPRVHAQAEEDLLLQAAQREIDNSRRMRMQISSQGEGVHSLRRSQSPAAARETVDHSPKQISPILRQKTPTSSNPNTEVARTFHDTTLEEAISKIQVLSAEVAVLRDSVAESEKAHIASVRMWEGECRRRQETEIHLHSCRMELEQAVMTREVTEKRSKAAVIQVTQLTEELRFSTSEAMKLQASVRSLTEERHNTEAELSNLRSSNEALERRYKSVEANLATVTGERDEKRNTVEALRSEVTGWERRHNAAAELWRAQQSASLSELQSEVDTLTHRLQEATQRHEAEKKDWALEQRVLQGNIENMKESLEGAHMELTRFRNEAFSAREALASSQSQWERDAKEFDRRLAAQQNRAESLLLDQQVLRNDNEKLASEISELRDVNHVLAVRLKAATVDKEAFEMETQARKLLIRQNDEMERQLQELRRTIQSLMGSHTSASQRYGSGTNFSAERESLGGGSPLTERPRKDY